ncbi:MAG: radical SAM protein [Vulcanimicrobiota bacterium]
MRYVGNVIRPPSEADSLILQATIGCTHNKCIFCGTYQGEPFRMRDLNQLFEDIVMAKSYYGTVKRVFLADGNALILPTSRLREILIFLKRTFPELQRVGIYSRANEILKKSPEELEELCSLGLKIVYIGLESGSDDVLSFINKKCTREEAIAGCLRAQKAGMKLSTIILLGLGGKKWSDVHAVESASLINAINPRYLSSLSLMVLPVTPLYQMLKYNEFELPEPEGLLREMRLFMENLEADQCIFRSNHASNYLPLSGTLKKDKKKLLSLIDEALKEKLFKPEFFRGL